MVACPKITKIFLSYSTTMHRNFSCGVLNYLTHFLQFKNQYNLESVAVFHFVPLQHLLPFYFYLFHSLSQNLEELIRIIKTLDSWILFMTNSNIKNSQLIYANSFSHSVKVLIYCIHNFSLIWANGLLERNFMKYYSAFIFPIWSP